MLSNSLRRALPLAAIFVLAVAALGVAASGPATSSKAGKVKVKCPTRVLAGQKKVTCRVFGRLPAGRQGPRGPKGAKGERGARGQKGDKGAAGSPGVSGYEVVSQTFEGVFVQNSGGMRGLSAVQTLDCPGDKRAIGGGTDLGTNATQNGVQRQITVSLSAPTGTGDGWSVQLFNNSTSNDVSIDLRVYAICATAN